MKVREAKASDAVAIDDVVTAAFREQGKEAAAVSRVRGPGGTPVPIPVAERAAWWEERLHALADAGSRIAAGVVIMGEVEGRVVATASVLPTETEHEWELVRVAVHPEARGQGFGLATVRAAFEAATSKGATSVRWCSDPFQTAAHAIYERFASSEVDEHGRRHYRIEI